jgi:hypothetical protein
MQNFFVLLSYSQKEKKKKKATKFCTTHTAYQVASHYRKITAQLALALAFRLHEKHGSRFINGRQAK